MRLFLPEKGWYIKLKKSLHEYADLIRELESANTNILEEPESDAVLLATYDITKLMGRPETKSVKEVWYWTTEDPVGYPEHDTLGLQVEVCEGNSVIYDDYDRAIIDLAGMHPPVARLLYLLLHGPDAARPLARAVLDGDRSAFRPLCDALEEAGHPDAKEIHKLAKAEPKKAKPQGGRGKPLPAAPTVAATPASKPTVRPAAGGQEVVVVGGFPCAGKTSYVQPLVEAGYQRLNRDDAGGTLEELHRHIRPLLDRGQSIVLDNLYPTRASRAALLAAIGAGVPVRFVLLETSLEDAMFNACLRMMTKHGRVLQPDDHKKPPYRDDPSAYPVAVLYKYRNDFERPSTGEGFAAVEGVPFVRRYPAEWENKAVLFDFDGTLRTHEGAEKFPCKPAEVRAMKDRAAKLRALRKQGYLLLGASNQSGVAKGKLTAADAEACFAETIRQLGVEFGEVKYCPHKVPPLTCYCRKPNPGMGVEMIVTYKLDPRQCIYVGDLGTDRSFAQKCGFQFADQSEFFTG